MLKLLEVYLKAKVVFIVRDFKKYIMSFGSLLDPVQLNIFSIIRV